MAEVTVINNRSPYGGAAERVCAYCRVSRSTADQLNSYERQIKVYTKLISSNPSWQMAGIFADEGITGTSAEKRPGFLRMIEQCELHKIDRIITKSVSRFARNVKEALLYVRKLKLLGVGVQFEKEGIYTLSMGDEMLLNTFAAIAEEESVEISIRLRNANKKRMADGDFIDGHAPYGFRLENRVLTEYKEEADIVRRIFSGYLSGMSAREIADSLNTDDIPSREGKKWQPAAIKYILKNEKYKGDYLCQKTYHTDILPFRRKRNRGEEDRYYAEDSHEGIVPEEVFDRANEIMAQRREKTRSDAPYETHIFTGMIKCAECGRFFCRRKCGPSVYWVCAGHLEDREKCPSHYIREERIQDAFITMINKLRYSDADILKKTAHRLEQAINVGRKNNTEAYGMSRQIADINSKLLMLEQLHTQGFLADEVYISQSRELQKGISALRGERQQTMNTVLTEKLAELNGLIKTIETVREPLETFDEDLYRNTAVSAVIDRNDNIEFTVKSGLRFSEPL